MRIDALTTARELRPLITRLRHETEGHRRIAQPIVDRLIETRLCRMALPTESHGLELEVSDALDVYEELAGAEASVAWVVWNNALPCLFARFLDPPARAEIFGEPRWLHASSTRPTGRAALERDGYRVSGRWALVSGCELAEWVMLMCLVEEGGAPRRTDSGEPELRLVCVRRSDFEVLDTWHVGGLRGTGSHDVVVADTHVPGRWTMVPGGPGKIDRPIGRVPIVCTMAAGYAAQALGIARACLDTAVALLKTKVTVDPGPGPRDRPAVQVSIARQAAALAAAREHLYSCVARLWAASSEAPPTLEAITSAWGAAHHAAGVAKNLVDATYAAGGTSSLYVDCPLERARRDMDALLRHLIGQESWMEDAGRVALGMPPGNPLYAL
jgi:indole-3-acetate monooxygenase